MILISDEERATGGERSMWNLISGEDPATGEEQKADFAPPVAMRSKQSPPSFPTK